MLDNLLNPTILFFFLGLLAALVRSDLEIPQPIAKFLSLYLLMAIGLKGGVELSGNFDLEVLVTLGAAILMAVVTPLYVFFILRGKVGVANAGAISATYGSVSAVTFATAANFLQRQGIGASGEMVATMALMEAPAILVGVALVRTFDKTPGASNLSWKEVIRDALLNGSVLLLLGSLLIGVLLGPQRAQALDPFTGQLFSGMLSFFLLDMGIIAGRRLSDLKQSGVFLIAFAVVVPFVNGIAGGLVATAIGLSVGDALLFTILCASASYIAVPAAVRHAIPAANPSLYLPMALGVTFPLNIAIGIPLYLAYVQWLAVL